MPPSSRSGAPVPSPVEFSPEDAVLSTWVEDTGLYLKLDADELTPIEEPPRDPA